MNILRSLQNWANRAQEDSPIDRAVAEKDFRRAIPLTLAAIQRRACEAADTAAQTNFDARHGQALKLEVKLPSSIASPYLPRHIEALLKRKLPEALAEAQGQSAGQGLTMRGTYTDSEIVGYPVVGYRETDGKLMLRFRRPKTDSESNSHP